MNERLAGTAVQLTLSTAITPATAPCVCAFALPLLGVGTFLGFAAICAGELVGPQAAKINMAPINASVALTRDAVYDFLAHPFALR